MSDSCEPMDHSLPGSSVHGISQEEFCSGLPFLSAEHLPNPGIEPTSTALAGGFFMAEPTGNTCFSYGSYLKIVKFFLVALYLGFSHQ